LTWRRAIGDIGTTELKDSTWNVANYGSFNGVSVVGPDEVMLGQWMDPIYKVPGSEGYTSDQAKAIGTSGKIIWAKHSSETPSEEGI